MNEHREHSEGLRHEEDIEYRPFNPLAMLALALAVIGCFAIGTMFVLPVNILAALLAIFAIRQSGEGQRFSGGGVAAAALFVAVAGGVMAVTYHVGRDWYLKSTARQYSMMVLQELANGRPENALSYGLDYNFRVPQGTDLKAYYQGTDKIMNETLEPYRQIQTWLQMTPIKEMIGDAMQGKLEFLGFGPYKRTPEWEYYPVDYRYTPSSPELPTVEFQIVMLRRDWGSPYDIQWRSQKFVVLKGPRQGPVSINRPPPSGKSK